MYHCCNKLIHLIHIYSIKRIPVVHPARKLARCEATVSSIASTAARTVASKEIQLEIQ